MTHRTKRWYRRHPSAVKYIALVATSDLLLNLFHVFHDIHFHF